MCYTHVTMNEPLIFAPLPTNPFENRWPMNIRWATFDDQSRNRRSNHWLTIGDETMVITDWATRIDSSNIKSTANRIAARLSRGWTPEQSVFAPIQEKHIKR